MQIRILVFQDLPGIWIARALEHDTVAEGRSLETAVFALLRLIRAHIDFDPRHNREPLSGFGAAPQPYWNAFSKAAPVGWATWLSHMLPIDADISVSIARERPAITWRGFSESSRMTFRAAHPA